MKEFDNRKLHVKGSGYSQKNKQYCECSEPLEDWINGCCVKCGKDINYVRKPKKGHFDYENVPDNFLFP